MSCSLSHIQHTAHYIVNRCQYSSGEFLSRAGKRRLHDEVVVALENLSKYQPTLMFIGPGNKVLEDLFSSLEEGNIVFPENTIYTMKCSGESFEKIKGDESTKIYDDQEVKHDHSGVTAQKYRAMRDGVRPLPLSEKYGDAYRPSDVLSGDSVTFLKKYQRNLKQRDWSKQKRVEQDDKFGLMKMNP